MLDNVKKKYPFGDRKLIKEDYIELCVGSIILLLILINIHNFLSSSQHEKIDRIFLAGGFVSIEELAEWLDDWLKIPTRVADPLRHVSLAEAVDHQDIRDNTASLLVACGLAMRGLACQ